MNYLTGEWITIQVQARDEFSNEMNSQTEQFELQITGHHTSENIQVFSTPIGDGLYQLEFQWVKVDDYRVNVKFAGQDIVGSPIEEIVITASDVQAKYSTLSEQESVLVAGRTYTWKIQAYDLYQNLVTGGNELFSLDVTDGQQISTTAKISYQFENYEASFKLTEVKQYAALVGLKQRGGLQATYYRTTDFQDPQGDSVRNSYPEQPYTQIDSQIDF